MRTHSLHGGGWWMGGCEGTAIGCDVDVELGWVGLGWVGMIM